MLHIGCHLSISQGYEHMGREALSLGADTLVPPGNFVSFSFGVDNIDQCAEDPRPDMELLRARHEVFKGKEFF